MVENLKIGIFIILLSKVVLAVMNPQVKGTYGPLDTRGCWPQKQTQWCFLPIFSAAALSSLGYSL